MFSPNNDVVKKNLKCHNGKEGVSTPDTFCDFIEKA